MEIQEEVLRIFAYQQNRVKRRPNTFKKLWTEWQWNIDARYRRELTLKGTPSKIIRELQAGESRYYVSCEFSFSQFPTRNREGWMYGTFPPIRATKMRTRYGSWQACRDCRAYAIGLQTRFKRRNVHRDTPDVSLHSCVSPLRHPQIEPRSCIVRVEPRRSPSERWREDTWLVSKVIAIACLIVFTAITI